MFNNGKELLKLCREKDKSISDIVIDKDVMALGLSYDEVRSKMAETLDVMKNSAQAGLDKEIRSISGLTGGNAKRMEDYRKNQEPISGVFINATMAKAFSTSEVNASMGKICASPTGGASGILPAAMIAASEKLDLDDDALIAGLFNAAGIGQIVSKNATVSGAEGGCQAECGVAAAMAASAIVEMAGGSPDQSLDAAGFALTNIMGLVCDPIAGLVEYPCALRNASGVINGLISADMALANVEALIPFDEVVEALYKVGKALPESLRETALGGLAATETAHELAKKIGMD